MVARIHPTATVDARALLADDVEVGPHCVITGEVRLGAGTRLLGSVYLHGPLTMGRDNRVYPFACLGFDPQDLKFDPRTDGAGVIIGDANVFRESVTIHRATGAHATTIGHRNYLMVNSHVGHDSVVGSDCIIANGALVAGHVELADRVNLSGNVGVHQFCRVGRLAMVGGVNSITRDLPPFCTVYNQRQVGSLNIVGLRRSGYRDHIAPLRQAFRLLYRAGLSIPSAIAAIEQELGHDPLCQEFVTFVRSAKRGICPYARRGETAAPED